MLQGAAHDLDSKMTQGDVQLVTLYNEHACVQALLYHMQCESAEQEDSSAYLSEHLFRQPACTLNVQ